MLSGKGWPMPQGRGFDWAPPGPTKPACLRKNTCYIVVALIFNEKVCRGMLRHAARPFSDSQQPCLSGISIY